MANRSTVIALDFHKSVPESASNRTLWGLYMHAERSQRINIVRLLAQVVEVIAILTILNEIAAATHTVEAEA